VQRVSAAAAAAAAEANFITWLGHVGLNRLLYESRERFRAACTSACVALETGPWPSCVPFSVHLCFDAICYSWIKKKIPLTNNSSRGVKFKADGPISLLFLWFFY